MYILGDTPMSDMLSIADFRKHLPASIQRAEGGDVIRISRHGVPVAVVISHARYQQLTTARPSLTLACSACPMACADPC